VLPSIGNEVLEAVVTQFNGVEFSRAVEQKLAARQEAGRSKFGCLKFFS
jgi:hypothetical protein